MGRILVFLACFAIFVFTISFVSDYLSENGEQEKAKLQEKRATVSSQPLSPPSPPALPIPPVQKKVIEWTPEKRVKNPMGYCQSKLEELSSLSEMLEGDYIQLRQAYGKVEAEAVKHRQLEKRLVSFLEEAKVNYRQAEETGKWPVVVQGEKFSRERIQEKILESSERIQTLRESLSQTSNRLELLQRKQQQVFEGLKRIVALRRKTEDLISDLRLKKSIEHGDHVKAVLDELEDALSAMRQDAKMLDLKTLATPTDSVEQNEKVKGIDGE